MSPRLVEPSDGEPPWPQAAVPGPDLSRELRVLGPTFPRIAHYLALRYDLFSPDVHEQLVDVDERMLPVPWPVVRKLLTETEGAEEFAAVDPQPLTSGALAQVHRAELRDGTEVAVKVRRPGAEEMMGRDLQRVPALERLLESAGIHLAVPVHDLMDEIREWLNRQLDLTNELGNVARLHELAGASNWERIPRPYPELSSSQVLVTEYVAGTPVIDLLLALRSGRDSDRERLHGLAIDPAGLARNLATVNLRQIFRYRLFQADLHPGNVLALPGDVVSFADFGSVVEVDAMTAEAQLTLLTAVFDDNFEQLLDPPVDPGGPSEEADLKGFRRDLLRRARARIAGPSGADSSGGSRSEHGLPPQAALLVEFLQASRVHGLDLPPAAQVLHRSVVATQHTAWRLDPDAGVEHLVAKFLRITQLEVAVRRLHPRNLQPGAMSLLALARDAPVQVQKLLSDLADGSFVLNVYASEAPSVEGNRNRRTRVVVGAVCSVSLAVLLTAPGLPSPFGVSVGWFLVPLLGLLYTWLFVQWRSLR